MPVYQQIIVAMPKSKPLALVELFKKYAKTIVSHGGTVRGIENHGIRPLSERGKRCAQFKKLILNKFIIYRLSFLQ